MPVGDEASAGQGLEREECGWWGDDGELGSGEVGGTVMCQRSDPSVLALVRKGVTEEGKSKNATKVLVEGVPVRANEG
jgi:hypothetical protein